MIRYTPEAEAQVHSLVAHYERLGRTDAARNLRADLSAAHSRISRQPQAGLAAPRPYPALAASGRFWIKEKAYWIACSPTPPVTILGVFHERADIPGRS